MQNKKWRVLIVDDEFRIGRLIKKLIHWGEFALECVDVVDNGGTAGQGTDVEITIPANYKTDREKDYEERIVEN